MRARGVRGVALGSAPMTATHELIEQFALAGLSLHATLVAMLSEHPDHRTERRGSGFTQATRFVAAQINEPRYADRLDDLCLFDAWHDAITARRILDSLADGTISSWRKWHTTQPSALIADVNGEPGADITASEAERQRLLDTLDARVEREESRLLARLIRDVILPYTSGEEGLAEIAAWPDKLEVGSCPTAEKWFLELAHGFIPRKGRCNLIVDDADRPLMLEKVKMGDSHSCISVHPFLVNGVRMPPGSLLAVTYPESVLEEAQSNAQLPGHCIRLGDCNGIRMLRLTTLAVSPQNRARAFSAHFEAQQAEGLLAPDDTELDQLRQLADREVACLASP